MRGCWSRKAAGFTLIEILVVVAILGILGALILPNLIGQDDRARQVAARADLQALANALDLYRLDHGTYPDTDVGLEALINPPSNAPGGQSSQSYLRKRTVPLDPWGTEYQYLQSSDDFELFSLGKDGQEGGEGYNQDIDYKDL